MSLLNVKINSARKSSNFSEVKSIFLPSLTGLVEILPDHMPLITELEQGEIRLNLSDGKDLSFLVSRGYARIKENEIVLLLDEVDQADELVKEEIERAIESAQTMMSQSEINPTELIQLEKRLRYEKFKLEKVGT